MSSEKTPNEVEMSDVPAAATPSDQKNKKEEGSTEVEKEFAEEVAREVSRLSAEAKAGGAALHSALEALFLLEKRCRMGEAVNATRVVAESIVAVCVESGDYALLGSNLLLLTKRRGQFKQVVKAVVQAGARCAGSLAELSGDALAQKRELVETLRTITEGKIFVEIERARLTKVLSDQLEKEGKVAAAAELLQEVQVETYGSMEKREKTEFILEQMRLTLDSQEYIRVKLLSSKIHQKILDSPAFQDCKVRFYELMIRFHLHDRDFLEVCRAYVNIFHTASVQADPAQWQRYLRLVIVFTVLSPHSPEQHDLLHRVSAYEQTAQLPTYRDLLKYFTTRELICWPKLEALYQPPLKDLPGLFDTEAAEEIWTVFHDRVVEHNIRAVSEYYKRIRLGRLSTLLDLTEEKTEEYISTMVDRKLIYARINRPDRVVGFVRPQKPAERLNDWSDKVTSLLDLLEKNSHLIHRENVLAAAAAK
eukprot:CAMPEP_0174229104 /NCGR_PEP_ID=MMETSP0417-20130205/161_1 /TAXON_ID=242541 /ORGANISM="Mayorella sp, Strain BSH-02190019" /LENGTH=477 /DNA_ID=CAMNT_0015306615 /DNA_START=70 /DNA_END=1503 /DNA_ORIENTATION=+